MLSKSAAGEPALELPTIAAYSSQVANQTPVATFAMPVSGLRFEPRVDVQSRNLAESQADVAIRGGVFENTGLKLGAVSLYDPQTGHYFAEIPIAPAIVLRLGAGFELRADNEFRVQENNLLRVMGGDDAFVSAVGVYYLPPRVRGLELSLLVDNLGDSDYQEVPAVPAARRQFSVGAACRW